MRILYCADQFPGFQRQVGGAEHALEDVMSMAKDAGHEVAVASRQCDLEKPRADVPFFRVRCVNDWNRRRPFFEWELLKYGIPFDPFTVRSFRQVLRTWTPDVVHFGNIHRLTFVPAREACRAGIPSVFSVFDYWAVCPRTTLLTPQGEVCEPGHSARCIDCMRAQKWSRRHGLRRRARNYARDLLLFHQIVVLSRHSAQRVQQAGVPPQRIRVIPLPVAETSPDDLRDPDTAARSGEILYIGWVQRRKGLKLAVQALGAVIKDLPTVQLKIIGEAAELDYAQEVHDTVKLLGLEKNVEFVGRLSREAVQQALLRAAAVVVPEQWENVSPVIITEALACGTPVVASNVGGIGESVEDGANGFLVQRDDASAFAAAFMRLLTDARLNTSMSEHARANARRGRTAAEIAGAWNELYRELKEN